MIEGYRPGPVRVDPVGVAPAEVVALALRCERLEAVAEAAWALSEGRIVFPSKIDAWAFQKHWDALDAALSAAGATGKAGT